MNMDEFLPEDLRGAGPYTMEQLQGAKRTGGILAARALFCDERHALHVDLGCCPGVISREEGAEGIRTGLTRDIAILSRVGQNVCFRVTEISGGRAVLSRAAAQRDALDFLLTRCVPGEILPAVVTNPAAFGAFCDVGCGVPALIGLGNISVSRVRHADERFAKGQRIYAAIKTLDPSQRRVTLTHKELLGTWLENASLFRAGQTVCGVVRAVREYGLFVELTPNLSGLAEVEPELRAGDPVSVYIKSIQPEKLKVKLSVIRKLDAAPPRKPPRYFLTQGRIGVWQYGTDGYAKEMTIF
jgi:small subunit ribosomal protein S1